MADIDLKSLNDVDFLKKMIFSLQKHVANLENVVNMMRIGHFIDANDRVKGSKEGLTHIKISLEERMHSKMLLEVNDNENNHNS